MLTGRRFILAGLSRLTVRVAEALRERNADVVVVGDPQRDDLASEAASLLDHDVRLVELGIDRDAALEEAGLADASGLLALDENDLENLRFVADAHELAPEVPCVLRTFQPELADAVAGELNIRRAYSVAALAAPAIVAAAVGEEVVETLRMGGEEVPLCVLEVHDSSPLRGETPDAIKSGTKCAVIAVKRAGGDWAAAPAAELELQTGDEALVGGRLDDVLTLALDNDETVSLARKRWRPPNEARRRRRHFLHASLLRVSALLFLVVFVVTTFVNLFVLGQDVNDALTTALGASFGNMPPPNQREWVQWFYFAALLAGVTLYWVLVSHLTALVLAERLELRMSRRARRMHDHVVVVGLGKVGYRVVQLLAELKVPTVAIEQAPNSTFMEAVALHTPVLTGDGALAENLLRTNIDRARCVIACTNDDLANLSACVEARRINPSIRTVTRAFDETVSKRLSRAFQADVVLSSTAIASSAFVGAAVDSLAMRPFHLDGLDLLAFRLTPCRRIESSTLATWRAKGLRVLALEREGRVEPPTMAVTHAIETTDEAIVVGPADVVRSFAAEYE